MAATKSETMTYAPITTKVMKYAAAHRYSAFIVAYIASSHPSRVMHANIVSKADGKSSKLKCPNLGFPASSEQNRSAPSGTSAEWLRAEALEAPPLARGDATSSPSTYSSGAAPPDANSRVPPPACRGRHR